MDEYDEYYDDRLDDFQSGQFNEFSDDGRFDEYAWEQDKNGSKSNEDVDFIGNNDEYDEDFQQPSYKELQQVSVRGKPLNPRVRSDAILIEIYNTLRDTFGVEEQSEFNSILERTEDIPKEKLIYYNPEYLTAAIYYMRTYKVLKKLSMSKFAEQYNLKCPALLRYIKIISQN